MSANIVASSLAVGYGHRPIISGVEFTLEPGALMVLIGTNGSGKSTLLKTLAGLLTAQSGSVQVLGAEPGTLPARVAYLPQHPVSSHSLPLRVHDIVAMGRFAHRGLLRRTTAHDTSIVIDVMKRTGADEFSARALRDLSGGQQQRVAVARALASKPRIIFADEPTGNLDSTTGAEILSFMRKAVDELGQTIVMVTHDPVAAAYADRIIFLADGHIVNEMTEPTADRVLDLMKSIGH